MILATLFGRLLCRLGLHDVYLWPSCGRGGIRDWKGCRRPGCYWAVVRKGGRR